MVWWALFGNRAAENNDEGHSVYRLHREKGNVKGFVWLCVLAILSGGLVFQDLTPVWSADLGVRVRPSYINDELAVADDAGEVTVFRKLEVDVALFPLGARLPGVDRLVRGECTRKRSQILLVPDEAREQNTKKDAEIGDVTCKSTVTPFLFGA